VRQQEAGQVSKGHAQARTAERWPGGAPQVSGGGTQQARAGGP
jgi:hypothetical protein